MKTTRSRRLVITLNVCAMLLLLKAINMDSTIKSTSFYGSSSNYSTTSAVQNIQATSLLVANNRQTRPLQSPARSSIAILLCLAGDIELNPGPRTPKCPCGICKKAVRPTDSAVCCDQCDQWLHNRCSGVSDNIYRILQGSDCVWTCPTCRLPNFSNSFFDGGDVVAVRNTYGVLSDPQLAWIWSKKCTSSHPTIKQNTTKTATTKPPKNTKSTVHRAKTNSSIRIISTNVYELRSKKLELEAYVHENNIDVVLVQETKVDSAVSSAELYSQDFNVYRNDRTVHGGGLCIAVSNKLIATLCPEFEVDGCESTWIKISIFGQKIMYLGNLYRPPSSKTAYIEALRTSFTKINDLHRSGSPPNIVITGDFNYSSIDWEHLSAPDDCNGHNLLDIMNDHYLTQLVKENTHLNIKTGETSLLNLVISSHPSLIDKPTIAVKISDHCIIDFIVFTTPAHQTEPAYRMYQYKKGNYDAIRKDVTTFSTNFI